MSDTQLIKLLEKLVNMPAEIEWLEFKHNNEDPNAIGEYISALANSACLHDETAGYLVFGVEDKTHQCIGTSFNFSRSKVGNEELENLLISV